MLISSSRDSTRRYGTRLGLLLLGGMLGGGQQAPEFLLPPFLGKGEAQVTGGPSSGVNRRVGLWRWVIESVELVSSPGSLPAFGVVETISLLWGIRVLGICTPVDHLSKCV